MNSFCGVVDGSFRNVLRGISDFLQSAVVLTSFYFRRLVIVLLWLCRVMLIIHNDLLSHIK